MPVEIRELVIRAEVAGDARTAEPEPAKDVDAIVAACVREVLAVLEKSKER